MAQTAGTAEVESVDVADRPSPDSARVPLPPAGVIVPVVTPLRPDGEVDGDSFDRLIEYLLDAGVAGLLVLGSSGENSALSREQREVVAARAVATTRRRAHVMIGVASLGTRDAVADGAAFADLGADSLLLSAPFGFQLSQSELATHLSRLAARAPVPVVAYNVPTRVHVTLEPDLVRQLAADGLIHGIKDSSGDLPKARVLTELTADLPNFYRYTGTEQCIDAALLGGFHASLAGLANVFPAFHVELTRRAAAGDWVGASATQGSIIELLRLYDDPTPGASFSAYFFGVVKEALVQLGVIAHNTVAEQFTQPGDHVKQHVARILSDAAGLHPSH